MDPELYVPLLEKGVDVFEGCPASLGGEDRDSGPGGDVAVVGCDVPGAQMTSYAATSRRICPLRLSSAR